MRDMTPQELVRLGAYLAHELTGEEYDEVKQWLDERPDCQGFVEYLAQSRLELGEVPAAAAKDGDTLARVDAIAATLAARVALDERGELEERRRRPITVAGQNRLQALGRQSLRGGTHMSRHQVAIIMACAIVSVVITIVLPSKMTQSPRSALPAHTYRTPAGQQATVFLPDRTRVLLGPATTLSVATRPSDASLDVQIRGQALFTVQRAYSRPFLVHAGHAVVRVLGTTFLVRQYPADNVTRVVVTDGRISLRGLRGTTRSHNCPVLMAGMLGIVDDSGNVQVTPNIAVDEYTGWTRGELVFHQTPVRNVVLELGRAYGVDLRVADSTLAARTISWTVLTTHRSLAGVLDFLTTALDVHVVLTGKIITLMPGGPAAHRSLELQDPRSPSPSERHYGK